MKYAYASKLSDRIFIDGIGQLICQDVVFAREGEQDYYEDEVFRNGSYNVITVQRLWEDVKKSAPTFEGKPIIELHPDRDVDVTIDNIDEFRKGHIQNVKEGTAEFDGETVRVLKADFVFNNKETIEKVKSKELRDVSAGYFYRIDESTLTQKDITGEHVALVPSGRAGIAKILDSVNGVLFNFTKYVGMNNEQRSEYISKIDKDELVKIREFYSKSDEGVIEKELVMKIIDKELNNRKTKDEIVQKANDSNLNLLSIPANRVRRGDVLYIKGFDHLDRRITRVVKGHDSFRLFDRHNNMLHNVKSDSIIQIENRNLKGLDEAIKIDYDNAAWVTEHVNDINAGDIISNFNSNTMYTVLSKDNLYLYLENIDTKKDTQWAYDKNTEYDVLIDATTHKKIHDTSIKASDAAGVKTVKDLVIGERLIMSNGDIVSINDIIINDNNTYQVFADKKLIYMDVTGDLEVSIDE